MQLVTILDRQDRSCLGLDPELFVSDNLGEQNYAKLVCIECPVLASCAQYAMERPYLVGIWGGTSTKDRMRMRKAA